MKTKKQAQEEKYESDYEILANFIMGKRRKVKIKVSGYIEMSVEDFNTLMTHEDPHMGLVYSMHMSYVDASNLEFEEIIEKKKK